MIWLLVFWKPFEMLIIFKVLKFSTHLKSENSLMTSCISLSLDLCSLNGVLKVYRLFEREARMTEKSSSTVYTQENQSSQEQSTQGGSQPVLFANSLLVFLEPFLFCLCWAYLASDWKLLASFASVSPWEPIIGWVLLHNKNHHLEIIAGDLTVQWSTITAY